MSGAKLISKTLLEEIGKGLYLPGDSLPSEQSLQERFGVSRSMVRDALNMLTGMGAIDRSRGRSGMVCTVDDAAISQLFPLMFRMGGKESLNHTHELRVIVEMEAVKQACRRAETQELYDIMSTAESYRSAVGSLNSFDQVLTLDGSFHQQIAQASGNPMLEQLLKLLDKYLNHVQTQNCLYSHERKILACEEHINIANALLKRDEDGSRIEMAHHLHISWQFMMAQLDENNPISAESR